MNLNIRKTSLGLLVAWGALASAALAQDSIQLKDGRFVMDKKMTRDAGGVLVHFKNGDVHIGDAMIKSTTARAKGKESELTPEQKAKAAKGLVLHKGRWIKKKIRDSMLAKDKKKRDAKIKDALAHRKWVKRYTTRTQNFEFQYTIDPEVMKGYMQLMEVYYKTFMKEWKIKKPPRMGRLKVCFYHDEEYYQQVSGARPGVIGYFRFVEPIELNFFYDRLDGEQTIDVMFHEANHYLTHLIDPKFMYPIWVNESLAEYYGASEWDPKRKKMKVGGLQEGRLAVIQDAIKAHAAKRAGTATSDTSEWQGLEELIRIKRGAFNSTHYAWGWSFVHFLLSDKRYAKKFKRFYIDLAKNRKIKKVLARGGRGFKTVEPDEQIKWLKSYLGVKSLEALEKEWHAYIKTLKAATHRGYHRAGQIALSRGMPIKAQRLFNISLDMGSKNALTYYGLGRAQYRKSKYQEALASFNKALEVDPLNGMFYIWKAKCLNRGGREDDDPEVQRLKKLALEIEPDNYQIMLELAFDGAIDVDK